MSGWATIGSVCFGVALVAGRYGWPCQRRGKRLSLLFSRLGLLEHFSQTRFVEHDDTELVRFFKLAPRCGARDDIVGLPRHRADHLTAAAFDQLFRFVARHVRQRSREDEGLAGKSFVRRGMGSAFHPHLYRVAAGSQLRDDLPIMLLREKLPQAFHQLRPDALEHRGKRRFSPSFSRRVLLLDFFFLFGDAGPLGTEQGVQTDEVLRENLGDLLSDSRNPPPPPTPGTRPGLC